MPTSHPPERNCTPVPLTPEQQQKLKQEFNQARFTGKTDFLQEWCKQSETLGEPPTETQISRILYDRTSICEYWLIDGFCRILLDRPYRDYSLKPVPAALKQAIEEKLQQFKHGRRISWRDFTQLWADKLNDFHPPSSETIRKFLNSDRESCEYWVINGLCQTLLDCSCDEWIQNFDIVPPEIESQPEPNPVRERNRFQSFPCYSWEKSPDVLFFYGREPELEILRKGIGKDGYRLVALLGMGGIGKTYLSVRFGQEIQDKFERVKWLSLSDAPSLSNLLAHLIQFLFNQPDMELPETTTERISLLMDGLRSHRCLLILDEWEAILASGELAGQYRSGYEDYGKLLQNIGKEDHQSCVLLTSREPSSEMKLLEAQNPNKNKSLDLQGLKEEDARLILKNQQLEDPDRWSQLIQLYRGNPLALMTICPLIKELFDGKVGAFLKKNTVVVDDALRGVLKQHLETLSVLEKEMMYWLAIAREPISCSVLKQQMRSPVSESECLQAMKSLTWRSLVEKSPSEDEPHFSLQPAVMKYITKNCIEQVCAEISEVIQSQNLERLNCLRTYQLVSDRNLKPKIAEIQIRLILTPIAQKLATYLKSDRQLAAALQELLSILEEKSAIEVGYAADNVRNLLNLLPAFDL